MNTERLRRFVLGFQADVLPKITDDNAGLVYIISQSLAEDPLVKDIANLKAGSGYSMGHFMGVTVKTMPDFKMEDHRV